MTLYAYDLNSVMAGMLAVLIPVLVAFAWLLQREQRKTEGIEWLLPEIQGALRAELHRHDVELANMNPRDVAHVPFAQAVPEDGKPADNGTLTVAAADTLTVPVRTLVFPDLWVSADGKVYYGDKPVSVGPHIRPEPEGGE